MLLFGSNYAYLEHAIVEEICFDFETSLYVLTVNSFFNHNDDGFVINLKILLFLFLACLPKYWAKNKMNLFALSFFVIFIKMGRSRRIFDSSLVTFIFSTYAFEHFPPLYQIQYCS